MINYFGYQKGIENWAKENGYFGNLTLDYAFQNLVTNLKSPKDGQIIYSVKGEIINHID